MKGYLYSIEGAKKSEIQLPIIFETPIREDIVMKCYESEKILDKHSYSPADEAGRRNSASGNVRHSRHKWKGHYGKGLSRIPRKTMWRRGNQFYWVGAEVSNTRGGRSVHAPTGVWRINKINKKERELAFASSIASTADKRYLSMHYPNAKEIPALIILEALPKKTKELIEFLDKVLKECHISALKDKKVRSGKGKRRGRKYKSNAGLLLITGKDEELSCKGIDIKNLKEVKLQDLHPLGRLTFYTKKAIEELGEKNDSN